MTMTDAGTTRPIDASQQRAARVVGAMYLLLMATGMFAQLYVPGHVPGSSPDSGFADSVDDIAESARLLRWGAAVDLLTNAGDVVLATAYFVLLRRVSPGLALLGAFWRLAQVAIVAGYTVATIVVLQMVTGEQQMRVFTSDQISALAWVALSSHTIGYSLGLVFLGLGSTVFCYLLYRSRYVPPLLAAFGIFSSLTLTTGSLITIVYPEATSIVNPALYVPMFFFEVTTGLLLLIRGVR